MLDRLLYHSVLRLVLNLTLTNEFLCQPIKRRDLGLVTDQVDGITETLEGQVQGNAEEADAERKAIMEDLENKFINMESDLKRLLNSVSAQNRNFRGIDFFVPSIISRTQLFSGT